MAAKMSDIEKRLKRRSASYDRSTTAILESISGVLEGIKLYAVGEGLLTEDNTLEMLAITHDSDTKFVFMVGIIKPNIGTIVMSSDGENFPVISEEDQVIYAKTLRISMSLDIIEENDAAATLHYILESATKVNELMEQLQEEDEEYQEESTPKILSDVDRDDEERLKKILDGATNPSGLFN